MSLLGLLQLCESVPLLGCLRPKTTSKRVHDKDGLNDAFKAYEVLFTNNRKLSDAQVLANIELFEPHFWHPKFNKFRLDSESLAG